MSEAIIVAIITGGLAIVSNIVVAVTQNTKTIYRIDQLEKKVEKHNQVVERVTALERDEEAQWRWIDEFKDKLT